MIVLLSFNLVGQIINKFFEIWQRGNVIGWFAYTKAKTSKLLKVTSENYSPPIPYSDKSLVSNTSLVPIYTLG